MPRKQIYANPAQRQKAFRERKKAERVEVDRDAHKKQHARFERLQTAVYKAAQGGDLLAVTVSAASIETLLENLTAAFEARAADVEYSAVQQNGTRPKTARAKKK